MNRDEDYLLDRAECELEAARAAAHPRAASAHFHLAGLLFDRFFRRKGENDGPTLSVKVDAAQAIPAAERLVVPGGAAQ